MEPVSSVNKVLITGEIADDLKLGQGEKSSYLFFSVKTTTVYNRKDGTSSNTNDYYKCACFGFVAENIATVCDKGNLVLIDGKLQNVQSKTKGGEAYRAVQILVQNCTIISRNGGNSGGNQDPWKEKLMEDEEIPF